MKTDPTFWLLARASGLTAYVLLTGSVLAGLVVKSRPFGRAVKTASATDVHRFLALLGLGMLVLHGVALMLDRTVHMTPAALLVPGLSPYRPASVAYGVLAAELAVLISSRSRCAGASACELAQAALGSRISSSSWAPSTG